MRVMLLVTLLFVVGIRANGNLWNQQGLGDAEFNRYCRFVNIDVGIVPVSLPLENTPTLERRVCFTDGGCDPGYECSGHLPSCLPPYDVRTQPQCCTRFCSPIPGIPAENPYCKNLRCCCIAPDEAVGNCYWCPHVVSDDLGLFPGCAVSGAYQCKLLSNSGLWGPLGQC